MSNDDQKQMRVIAENVFSRKIQTYPLFGKIMEWIRIFQDEITELKKQIKTLENEIIALKQSQGLIDGAIQSNTDKTQAMVLDKDKNTLSASEILDIRQKNKFSIRQMAKLLQMTTKKYTLIEHGRLLPTQEINNTLVKIRNMKASELRVFMQQYNIYYPSGKIITKTTLSPLPRKREIKITRDEIQEICDVLQISHPQLAQRLNVTLAQVSGWLYRAVQPSEDNFQKIKELQQYIKNLLIISPEKQETPPKPKCDNENGATAEEINTMRNQLKWTCRQLSAYLHTSENKVQGWIYGKYSVESNFMHQIRCLQRKIKNDPTFLNLMTLDDVIKIKKSLQCSDYRLSVILGIPFSRVNNWSYAYEIPNKEESDMLRKLSHEIERGTFKDNIELPVIPPEKLKELCISQNLTKNALAKLMKKRKTTIERWLWGTKQPNKTENEKLWELWGAPPPQTLPLLTGLQIRSFRLLLGLSQEKMGKFVGISPSRLSDIELGYAKPTLSECDKIKDTCGYAKQDEEK